ncbi:MAG: GMC family oxidoreductase N-terminal domain-containing protein [Thermomicrobiales bacterium]|nr:GMC family oxidoreductase N-terminal domain-containing protein [Thermomicrobiales bacterium]
MSQFFDIVIVGAGSAGCALANRLSTDPALRVGLLEAGGDDSREAIRVPHQYFSLWGTDVDWQYVSTAQPGTRGRTHVMPRGRVMGGTSSLNGMVYLRGAASDYDAWASAGCTGWGWSDVVPSFEAMEAWLRPAVLEPHNPVSVAMRDAAVEFGLPLNPDFDSGTLDGSGWNKSTILDGERHNANRAFLEPIAERENLRIIPETRVSRVMFEGNRVTGLEVIQNGRIDTIAAGEVILAAGAFESPRILMLSGIGPADHLIDHGIVPHHNLPVGNNLIDHLLIGVVYTSRRPVPAQHAFTTEGCAFVRSTPDRMDCDIEISFAKEPHFAPEAADGLPRYTIIPGITKPKSRGTVRLTGADLDAPLAIDPNYFADPADMACMIRAVRVSREIGKQAALEDWNAGEFFPGIDIESDEEIDAYVRKDVSTWFHPAGTCRMGVGEDAVVDPVLRVRGLDGLRVADASIMPDIVGVNTNAASTMIGWHAAELFLRG